VRLEDEAPALAASQPGADILLALPADFDGYARGRRLFQRTLDALAALEFDDVGVGGGQRPRARHKRETDTD